LPNNLFRIFKGYPEMFNMSILNQSIHQSIYPSVHNSKVSRFIPLTPIWCWQASQLSQKNIIP
jgi:hypothetical protein